MRAFLCGLGKQDAIVGDDPNRTAHNMGKPRHQRFAETRFEFIKSRPINQTHDHFADVIGGFQIRRNHAKQFGGIIGRILGRGPCDRINAAPVQRLHHLTCQRQRMCVILGQIIGHAG